MPVHTEKEGKHWVVKDDKGKVYGRHPSKSKANAQTTAVNIATGEVPGVKPKKS